MVFILHYGETQGIRRRLFPKSNPETLKREVRVELTRVLQSDAGQALARSLRFCDSKHKLKVFTASATSTAPRQLYWRGVARYMTSSPRSFAPRTYTVASSLIST